MEGGEKGFPFLDLYSAMMKPDTALSYLKKIQKIYESRDTLDLL